MNPSSGTVATLISACLVALVSAQLALYMISILLYRIVRNFRGLVENKIFVEDTFVDCLLVPSKDAMPPNFVEKNFANTVATTPQSS